MEFDMQQFDEFTLCGSCQGLASSAEQQIGNGLTSVKVPITSSQTGSVYILYCLVYFGWIILGFVALICLLYIFEKHFVKKSFNITFNK